MSGLLLYAIIGFGALAALGGIYATGHHAGTVAQQESDRPIIAKAEGRAMSAEAANEGFKRDLASMQQLVTRSNAEVERLSKVGQEAKSAVRAAIAASDARSQRDSALVASLTAGAQGQGVESPKQCPKTWGILGDLSDIAHTDASGSLQGAPGVSVVPAPAQPLKNAPAAVPAAPRKPLPPAIRVKP